MLNTPQLPCHPGHSPYTPCTYQKTQDRGGRKPQTDRQARGMFKRWGRNEGRGATPWYRARRRRAGRRAHPGASCARLQQSPSAPARRTLWRRVARQGTGGAGHPPPPLLLSRRLPPQQPRRFHLRRHRAALRRAVIGSLKMPL